MTPSLIFKSFGDFLVSCFNFIFDDRFFWLVIFLGVPACTYIVLKILRWFARYG